ncbi:MAG: hypothetical protein AAF617_13060 [Bacteroidota bacterium]
MKLPKLCLVLLAALLFSCEFSTYKAGYLQDYTVDRKGISCDGIAMSNYMGIVDRTEFYYGEKITFAYENMTGFHLQEGLAYPDMDIHFISKQGDTLMSNLNQMAQATKGYTEADLNLRTELVFATPMLPNNEYIAIVHVHDKHSDAYYKWSKNFTIIHSPLIQTTTKGMRYDIQYLYSQLRNTAVIDNKIQLNETLYLLIENLDGFNTDEDGNADLQASIRLTANDGTMIDENDNLFPNLVNANDLKEQLYAAVKITNPNVENPVTCVVKITDNRNGNSLETAFDLTVMQ